MNLEANTKLVGSLFLNFHRDVIGHLLDAIHYDWCVKLWRQSVKGDAWRAPLASSISILICVRERREYVAPRVTKRNQNVSHMFAYRSLVLCKHRIRLYPSNINLRINNNYDTSVASLARRDPTARANDLIRQRIMRQPRR